MKRYDCSIGVNLDALGEYVKFEDVKVPCSSTVEFVSNLFNLFEAGELSKSEAVHSLEVMP